MFRTNPGAFTVNSLRRGNDYFSDWQVFLANNFQHLRGPKRIDVHVLRDVGHVAAVSGLMKDHVDFVECGANRFGVAQIAFNKFRSIVNP